MAKEDCKTETVHFNLEKMSKRYVKKSGTTSCIMLPWRDPKKVKPSRLNDILTELDGLFTKIIGQVQKPNILCMSFYKEGKSELGNWLYCVLF